MAEIRSPRRAMRLSSSKNRRADLAQGAAVPPHGPAMTAATDFIARLAGRKPSWAVLGALTVVVALFAATIVLLLDLGARVRASNRPIAVSLPLPSEHAAPTNVPASAEPTVTSTAPPESQRQTTEWFLARASEGDPTAQYEMALRYAKGRGVAKDYTRAAAWFREAAINGIAAAQYDLGILYDKGLGLARDQIEAVIWYQSAADQNEPIAQLRLGTIYLAGGVVPRNPAEAARWLRRAAEQGVAEAQAMLAARYEAGDGAAQSNAAAYGWYSLAADAGLPEAQLAKARLAQGFSAKELEEGEHRAARLSTQMTAHTMAASRQDADGLLLTSFPAALPAAVPRGAVGEIQRLLSAGGYESGPADGFLGEQTIQAIRRYQQDLGLPVDGSPSIGLLNRLRAAAAGPPPAAQP